MMAKVAQFADGESVPVNVVLNGERTRTVGVARWQDDGTIWLELDLPPGGCHVDMDSLRIADDDACDAWGSA